MITSTSKFKGLRNLLEFIISLTKTGQRYYEWILACRRDRKLKTGQLNTRVSMNIIGFQIACNILKSIIIGYNNRIILTYIVSTQQGAIL